MTISLATPCAHQITKRSAVQKAATSLAAVSLIFCNAAMRGPNM